MSRPLCAHPPFLRFDGATSCPCPATSYRRLTGAVREHGAHTTTQVLCVVNRDPQAQTAEMYVLDLVLDTVLTAKRHVAAYPYAIELVTRAVRYAGRLDDAAVVARAP